MLGPRPSAPQAPCAHPIGIIGRRLRVLGAIDGKDVVEVHVQGSLRGNARVELPDRTRGRIAWIREKRLAGAAQQLVQCCEVGTTHEHLAAHRKQAWNGDQARSQAERHGANRPHVCGHVLPTLAVAAGGGRHQPSALVHDFNR